MDCGGFIVQGSRPPSANSSHRPSSAQSKHQGYHTISRTSFADESLFGSIHQSKKDELLHNFKAPWECPKPLTPGHTYASVRHYKAVLASNKSKPKDPPLVWCPAPGSSKHIRSSKDVNSSADDVNYHWNTRSHFRHLKHTPTFVDESLFGKKLEEPSFKAPWNIHNNSNSNHRKDEHLKYSKPYLWDPSGDSRIQANNGVEINIRGRPLTGSRSGSRRPKSAIGLNRNNEKNSSLKPVWK